MSDAIDEMGPIDYVVIEFPGNRMTGEAFPLLLDLVDRGLVRILDLTFVRKDLDGSVAGLEIADLTAAGLGELEVFQGASSRPARRGRPRGRRRRPRTGQLRRRPGIREPVGRAPRRRDPPGRGQARGRRPDPRPGRARLPGRRGLRPLMTPGQAFPPTTVKLIHGSASGMPGLLVFVAR